MTFQSILNHNNTLKRDYQKLKQVLKHPDNRLEHLPQITKYVALFCNKYALKDDSIILLELDEIYEKFKQSLIN